MLFEIAAFASTHKKEILILDFNHFYAMTSELHVALSELIMRYVGANLADNIGYSPETPIKEFWRNGRTVIVYYHDHGIVYGGIPFLLPFSVLIVMTIPLLPLFQGVILSGRRM